MTDEKYGTAEDPRWTGEQGRSPLPLLGYAAITGTFLLGVGGLLYRLERDGRLLEEVRLADLALLGLGSQQLSRMITRDRVTTVFRAPFTTYAGTRGAAPGEANEVARRSNTFQQAIGELVTCPFCMTTWTTTALFGAYLVNRDVARTLGGLLGTISVAQVAQSLYGKLIRERPRTPISASSCTSARPNLAQAGSSPTAR